MFKRFSALLLIMLLTLCSCSSAPSGSSTPESEAEATAAFEPISIYYVTTPYYNYIEEKLELAEDGELADLGTLLEADSTYQEENYVDGVMQAGRKNTILTSSYWPCSMKASAKTPASMS